MPLKFKALEFVKYDAALNIITKPLPLHQEGNVNAIITVEKRVLNFSSLSFPWKAMLRALVQESHLYLKGMGTLGFDWEICSFCDSGDMHALFDCRVLRAQVQSLANHVPPSSVVIEEIMESLVDLESSDLGKWQTSPTIEGFTPLVLALPAIAGPASSSVQEGTTIVPAIRGFDPFLLSRPTSGLSRVSGLKAL
ncbi:hypothetical protein SO802_000006 [Lithocarpus litseifolius]|uniref:Uncharacterized protein n=1 Tax=Lithocarpus litseifolius TaxID=425828 RepID=A0AAW2DQC5_9ROSI